MNPRDAGIGAEAGDEIGRISARLLTTLFVALEEHGISTASLIGDLPIAVDEDGRVAAPVPWDHASAFLRRLEHRVGGPEGLEGCGEWVVGSPRRRALRRFAARAASPFVLFRAATTWILPRAIAGLEVRLQCDGENRLSLEIRLPDGLRPCIPLLHVAAGALRALPRLLDMPDAVVSSRAEERSAHYDVTLPASRTVVARLRRRLRSFVAPGFVLRHLEDRQLELHARHANLARALETSLANERQLRALSDAVVDMLCEIDGSGRIVFASAAVRELMGYSAEQVTGSHYRLWVPSELHEIATRRFEAFRSAPIGTAVLKQRVDLHAAHGRRVAAEVSARSHVTAEGEWRAVATLRDLGVAADEVRRPAPLPLEPLLAGLDSVRARLAGHPLEGSLAKLVGLLEHFEDGPQPERADRMIEATRRMALIVEHALIGEPDGEDAPQWIETGKLVDRLRDAQENRIGLRALPIFVDATRGPAEIHGREGLLDVCLAGLVDWANERAALCSGSRRVDGIALSIVSAAHTPGSEPAILIRVEIEDVDGRREDSGNDERPANERAGVAAPFEATPGEASFDARDARDSRDAELALAIARDAARALGGELLDPRPASAGDARTVRLPQPIGPA